MTKPATVHSFNGNPTTDFSEAIAAMRLDGLQADSLIADGNWHRCQADSASGRRNQDGSYKVITLIWITIVVWSNWKTGVQGKWTSKADSGLTRKERKELEAELAKAKEEDRKRREAAQAEAARIAQAIWEKAKPANADHGYLKRKEVEPGPCRQLTEDMTDLSQFARASNLVMPLFDANNKLVSLQFIAPEKPENGKDKFLLTDGKKQGSYCQISAKNGNEQGPLLIAEGFATAMSLNMATSYEAWVAIDCHNLDEVVKLARTRFPDRVIVVCADYDEPFPPNYPGKGGIGAFKGRKAAEKNGAYYALCPVWEGRSKADFNDMACDLGLQRVQDEIEAVLKSGPATACIIPKDFILRPEGPEAGLYWIQTLPGGTSKEVWLGDPLHILGYTRTSDSDNWGLLLAWKDRDGRDHQYALPKSMLANQRSEWLPLLADQGWACDSAYKKQIARYLEVSRPLKRIRCVTSTGWSDDRYVLPDDIYGAGEDQIILQAQGYKDLYQSKGTLEDWQELARLCVGNPKLGFALSCAFAGPLLELADMGGCIFNFEGGSSCGKTTGLTAAASVWGKPNKHVEKWRATDNSLEVTASLHNDCLLILDELGEAKARTLAEAIYMLAGGQGKKRAARDGGLRKTYHWNTITLSSGELGLGDKLLEAGRQSRGGLDARFVAIPVSREDIANLHGMANSGLLVRQIQKLANTNYGIAGHEFLKRLTQDRALQAAKDALQDGLEEIADSFCPADCDGQVRRVALRFALVSIAGTLAREFGILPAEFEAAEYARACFKDWLEQRGGKGPAEDMAILNQVQLFIEQHGQSRFQDINDSNGICPNRVGFRENKEGGVTYYCLPQAFKVEIIKGHSVRQAVEVLATAGWMRKRGDRYQLYKRLPDHGPKWIYEIRLPEAREEA